MIVSSKWKCPTAEQIVRIGEDVSAHWLHGMTHKIPNTFYLRLSTSMVF